MNPLWVFQAQGFIKLCFSGLNGIGANGAVNAFQTNRLALLHFNQVIHLNIGFVADKNATGVGAGLQTLSHIHFATNDGVAQTLVRAEVAHIAIAGVDANANDKRLLEAPLSPTVLQYHHALLHLQCHFNAGPRIFFHTFRFRVAEKKHHRVANVFVDGGAIGQSNLRHL